MAATAAQADGALFGARVGAVDVPKIAKFYETVFGLKETNRLELPGLFEIMLELRRFGGRGEEEHQPDGRRDAPGLGRRQRHHAAPHLHRQPTSRRPIAAVKANGGKLEGEPKAFGKSTLAFAIDPAGNHVEIIQQGK